MSQVLMQERGRDYEHKSSKAMYTLASHVSKGSGKFFGVQLFPEAATGKISLRQQKFIS